MDADGAFQSEGEGAVLLPDAVEVEAEAAVKGPYATAQPSLVMQPMFMRLLVLEMGYIYSCFMGLRRCRWITGALTPKKQARRSARTGAQKVEAHPLQVYLPPTPLETVRLLPLNRGIAMWNALNLEAGEVKFLESGSTAALGWWRKFGHRIVRRSEPQLKTLFPSFPFDLVDRL